MDYWVGTDGKLYTVAADDTPQSSIRRHLLIDHAFNDGEGI